MRVIKAGDSPGSRGRAPVVASTLGDVPEVARRKVAVVSMTSVLERAETPDASLRIALLAAIEERHTDPRLDVSRLARELFTSRRQLYRLVDGGVAALLTQRRVATAEALLVSRPELSIEQVAARSGFTSSSRLRAQLHRMAGKTPTEYRRSGHAEVDA